MAKINEFEIPSLEGLENIDVTIPLKQSCIVVMDNAKQNCPTDTGRLKNSITYDVVGNVGEVGTNVEYAPYVEFGTGKFAENGDGRKDVPWRYQTEDGKWHSTKGQKPQRYLRPALDSNRDKIVEIFKQAIKEGVK